MNEGGIEMNCKYCDCTTFDKLTIGPHLGVYCHECGTWQCWEKQFKEKSEPTDQQEATDKQIIYIRNLIHNTKISKSIASEIIKILGGESD